MKHALDILRDALPVVATLPGEGEAHIPAGVGIKVPARQVADDRAARSLSECGVKESGPFDDTERAMVQACLDPVLAVGAEQVLAAAAGLGVDTARFARYADRRWGPGWMRNANDRHQVLDEIERYRNDPEGFADKIDAHLNLPGKPA
jgi:predicted kinase